MKNMQKNLWGLYLLILFPFIFVLHGCGEALEEGITVSDVVEMNPQLGECLIASKPSFYLSFIPWEDTLAKDVHHFSCDLMRDGTFVPLDGLEHLTGLIGITLKNINFRLIDLNPYVQLKVVFLSAADDGVLSVDISNLSEVETLQAVDVGDIALPPNNKIKNIFLSLAPRVDGAGDSQLDLTMLSQLEHLTLASKYAIDSAPIIDLTGLTALQDLSLLGSFSEVLLPIAGSLETFLYNKKIIGSNAKSLDIDLSKQASLSRLTLSGNFRSLSFPDVSAIEYLSLDLAGESPNMLDLVSLKGLKSASISGDYSEITFPLEPTLVALRLSLKNEFPELINADFKSLKSLALELSDMDQNQLDLKSYEVFNLEELSLSGGNLSNIILPNLLYLTHLTLDAKMEFLDLSGSPKLSYVDLDTPNLSGLTFNDNAPLREIKVSDSKLISLDLSGNNSENLVKVVLSKSNVVEIEFPTCLWLNELTIEGAPNLQRLDLSGCSSLNSLVLGRNSLPSLDLTSAWHLRILEYYSPPTLTRIDINHLAEPDIRIYKYPLIAELDETLVPDPVLRKCVRTAAEETNAVFLAEIERLDCIGADDPSHLESLVEFATGSGEYENTRIFDATGIGLMKNLNHLNLTGNWISVINLNGLDKLNTLILDNNIIQYLNVNAPGIETLSVNENPLKSIGLRAVKTLFMNGGVEWVKTQSALNNLFDITEMKTTDGGFISVADYNEPVVLSSTNGFFEEIITNRKFKTEVVHVF